jgi:hypothetical protein
MGSTVSRETSIFLDDLLLLMAYPDWVFIIYFSFDRYRISIHGMTAACGWKNASFRT